MAWLKSPFNKSAQPLVLPAVAVRGVFWAEPDRFEQDNAFTDYIFRTLGVSRVNHLRANTFLYLARPEQVFMLGTVHDAQEPLHLPGSAGVFATTYTPVLDGKRQGLAFMVRDRIATVEDAPPGRNVVCGIRGVYDEERDVFTVQGLVLARLNERGRVCGLDRPAVNFDNARKVLLMADLCVRQMLGGKEPLLAANLATVEKFHRENLDNKGPRP